MDALVTTLFQEIERFKTTGPSNAQVADARAALARDLETNSRDNGYLLNQITFKYQYERGRRGVFNMRAVLRSADARRRFATRRART